MPVFYENVLKQVSVFPSACVCTKICFCLCVCLIKCAFLNVWLYCLLEFCLLLIYICVPVSKILLKTIGHFMLMFIAYFSFVFVCFNNYHYITSSYAFFLYSYLCLSILYVEKHKLFFRKSFHFQTFYYFSLIRISNNPFKGGFSFPSALFTFF